MKKIMLNIFHSLMINYCNSNIFSSLQQFPLAWIFGSIPLHPTALSQGFRNMKQICMERNNCDSTSNYTHLLTGTEENKMLYLSEFIAIAGKLFAEQALLFFYYFY
jgi:hypothetical protein